MTPIRLRVAALAFTPALALSTAAGAAAEPPRTITVEGHGEAGGAPDQAVIAAGVTTQAKTAAAAMAANASAMNDVFAALKRLGIADKNIRTSNYSVSPQYAAYNSTDGQRVIGYQATNEVSVTIDHIANVGAVVDALGDAGANQMNSISFAIHDPKPLMAEARTEAVEDATARAETLTKAAHVTLGPILSIADGDIGSEPRPVLFARAMASAAPPPTPIAVGTQEIAASVTITWEIK
jgi:uncharacterized protein YggE